MNHKIVGVGASSMAGVGDTVAGGFFKRIQTNHNNVYLNKGVGGYSTHQMIENTKDLINEKPFILIVLLGCNDVPRVNDKNPKVRNSLEVYAANLKMLFHHLKSEKNLFITSFPVDPVRTGVQVSELEKYMNTAKNTAQDAGYEIIDLYSLIKKQNKQFLADDGMHFNPDGHQYIADKILNYLG